MSIKKSLQISFIHRGLDPCNLKHPLKQHASIYVFLIFRYDAGSTLTNQLAVFGLL